ncbi:MAG: integrin alpha, partial [Phycisphaerae bacterium]
AVTAMGDLDGDGVGDLAVGASGDDGGANRGAVWVLFLNTDGTVKSHQKISDTQGGFTGMLDDQDTFGITVAALGDHDGDGVGDLAVGANGDDDGGAIRGAVWVLFLNTDGTVKAHQKISDTEGGFTGTLDDGDGFGTSVASLGDHDGDGVGDLAVGAVQDDDGGTDRGAVWVLFLNTDGTVNSHQKISDTRGGGPPLDNVDRFGTSAASLGDLDGDGVGDLAVGVRDDDDGGQSRGAVWVLFLNEDGTVKTHQKISDTEGGFTGELDDGDIFGLSVAALGDLDGDGMNDLAVGAPLDDDGGPDRGATWMLFLNLDGTVNAHQKISDTEGGFTELLDDTDGFGISSASLGDLDGDGVGELAVGAWRDDDGGLGRGAVWVLFLNTDGTVKSHQKISDTKGGFTGILDDDDAFGWSVASLGDLDGDGVGDLAVGATWDGDGGKLRGAVWILFLKADGTVKSHQKISSTQGGFTGTLDDGDFFGSSVASLGDHDGDGVGDLAVGARSDDDGGFQHGAVWVLFLNSNGTVKSHQKISDTEGGFTGTLDDIDQFGISAAWLGDLDGDSVGDLAVGAHSDADGGENRGAVWILFLNADGTVKSHQKISDTQGSFTGILEDSDFFGFSVTSLGDFDGDSVVDLAVGAWGDNDGSPGPCDKPIQCNRGAAWILFLNDDGTVKAHQKISDTEGGFTGILDDDDRFGISVASLGDLDGDGVGDLAVGAPRDDDGGTPPDANRGAVWVLFLDDGSCPWDLDANGSVGVSDLLELLASWGPCPPKGDCPADFDENGFVGVPDLLAMLANWGPCP